LRRIRLVRGVRGGAAEARESAQTDGADSPQADEVPWKMAIEAGAWLLGGTAPEREVPPEERLVTLCY
jgi:hypothetical protein